MSDLVLKPVDATYIKVDCDAGVAMELATYFTFEVPNAKYSPKFKMGVWDGKIRLYNPLTRLVYRGLTKQIEVFARDRGYSLESHIDAPPAFSEKKLRAFIDHINPKYEVRDYQFRAFSNAVNNQRGVFISPTASGKSFIIYLITRLLNAMGKSVLIIVPTTALVEQMKGDFLDYNRDAPLPIHCIYDGAQKKIAPITISTWQSIYKLKKPFFANFGGIVGDEVHTFKATSLKSIMENSNETYYRIGTTGTLDGSQSNELTLEGLFGPIEQVTDYDTLIKDGHIVKPKVKAIVFGYSKESKKLIKTADWAKELEFVARHERRNQAITSLIKTLKGNTLVLFSLVDKHGIPLYDRLKEAMPERNHYLIYGGVDTEEREKIRHILETEDNAVAVCSYQTFSTGNNVKKLHHLVFAGPPGKSVVRVLQSIGRLLRTHVTKEGVTIWDLADDLRYEGKPNAGLNHLEERLNIYDRVGFDYTIHQRNLE